MTVCGGAEAVGVTSIVPPGGRHLIWVTVGGVAPEPLAHGGFMFDNYDSQDPWAMEYSMENPRIANINYLASDTCQLFEILLDSGSWFGVC